MQVPAKYAYGILGANLIMYSAGLLTGLMKGSQAAERYFLTFCQINERIIGGEYYRWGRLHFGNMQPRSGHTAATRVLSWQALADVLLASSPEQHRASVSRLLLLLRLQLP